MKGMQVSFRREGKACFVYIRFFLLMIMMVVMLVAFCMLVILPAMGYNFFVFMMMVGMGHNKVHQHHENDAQRDKYFYVSVFNHWPQS